MPAGNVSSTVVMPLVAAEPEFVTLRFHVPFVPAVKFPACDLAIDRFGSARFTTVGSDARSFEASVSPAVLTVAEFVTPFGLFQHAFNAAALSLITSGLIAWMWVRADREPLDWSRQPWTKCDTLVATVLVALNVAVGVAPQFVVNRLQPSLISLLPVDRETTSAISPTPPVAPFAAATTASRASPATTLGSGV